MTQQVLATQLILQWCFFLEFTRVAGKFATIDVHRCIFFTNWCAQNRFKKEQLQHLIACSFIPGPNGKLKISFTNIFSFKKQFKPKIDALAQTLSDTQSLNIIIVFTPARMRYLNWLFTIQLQVTKTESLKTSTCL